MTNCAAFCYISDFVKSCSLHGNQSLWSRYLITIMFLCGETPQHVTNSRQLCERVLDSPQPPRLSPGPSLRRGWVTSAYSTLIYSPLHSKHNNIPKAMAESTIPFLSTSSIDRYLRYHRHTQHSRHTTPPPLQKKKKKKKNGGCGKCCDMREGDARSLPRLAGITGVKGTIS